MIPRRYIARLPGLFASTQFPDTWIAGRRRNLGTFFITDHATGSSWKAELLDTLRVVLGQAAVGENRSWHLHHIMELRHCAELDVHGWLEDGRNSPLASREAPCVLLSSEEHTYYTNRTLGVGETPELFLTEDPWKAVIRRSREARRRAATTQGRTELRRKAARFRELYDAAYDTEGVLKPIALRVLDHFAEAL